MAIAREYEKWALVIGVLSTNEEKREALFSILREEYGPILITSPSMEFSFTDYYDSEMGSRPLRYFLLFSNLVDPSSLSAIKLRTNEIEAMFAESNNQDRAGQRRTINLDPGIMSLANFILATCKDRSHRIPLQNGIYGETTLIYQDKDFQTLPWTYADYASEEVKAILRDFRSTYKRLLKAEPHI
ncbi:MAG: DUF4416 family protein [Sphaerochaetaceae bacterium]|nr:DUF4416 family protein [Sphaerochaetaceae bacterium]